MATIVTRAGKGSPLTNAEVDGNFQSLLDGLNAAGFTVSDTEPTGVANGKGWYDSSTGRAYLRFSDQWLEIGSANKLYQSPWVTWDSTKTASKLRRVNQSRTLSRRYVADYTATDSGAVASAGKSAGKHYFEVALDSHSSMSREIRVGLAQDGYDPATALGAGASSWAYMTAAYKYHNGTSAAYGVVADMPNHVMVAYDADAGKMWVGYNGAWMGSGDPAAGTNPTFTGLSGTIYPAVTVPNGNYNVTDRVTGMFHSAGFKHTPPTGFSAWGDSMTADIDPHGDIVVQDFWGGEANGATSPWHDWSRAAAHGSRNGSTVYTNAWSPYGTTSADCVPLSAAVWSQDVGATLGSGDLTMEALLRIDSFLDRGDCVAFQTAVDANNRVGVRFVNGVPQMFNVAAGVLTGIATAPSALATNTDAHIAFTYRASDGAVELLVDKVVVATGTAPTGGLHSSAYRHTFGGNDYVATSSQWIDGKVQRYRITKAIRTAAQMFSLTSTAPISA